MKVSDLKKMSKDELLKKEKELRDDLANLSFQHKIRPLEDTSRLKIIRKDIARILTISRDKAEN